MDAYDMIVQRGQEHILTGQASSRAKKGKGYLEPLVLPCEKRSIYVVSIQNTTVRIRPKPDHVPATDGTSFVSR